MKIIVPKRFARFLVSGGSAAITEYGVFVLLSMAGAMLFVANTVSFVAGLLLSFSLNRMWVFNNRSNGKRQLFLYLLLAFINILISNLVILVLVHLGVMDMIAKIITMACIAAWNYFVFAHFIFKRNE